MAAIKNTNQKKMKTMKKKKEEEEEEEEEIERWYWWIYNELTDNNWINGKMLVRTEFLWDPPGFRNETFWMVHQFRVQMREMLHQNFALLLHFPLKSGKWSVSATFGKDPVNPRGWTNANRECCPNQDESRTVSAPATPSIHRPVLHPRLLHLGNMNKTKNIERCSPNEY